MSVDLRYISGRFGSFLAKFGLKMGIFKGLNNSKNNCLFYAKIGSYLIQIVVILQTKSRTLLNVRFSFSAHCQWQYAFFHNIPLLYGGDVAAQFPDDFRQALQLEF